MPGRKDTDHRMARFTLRAFAPALVAALTFAAPFTFADHASAQDVPWGQGKKTEKPAKKPTPKAPARKAPAPKKAPTAKAPAQKAPAQKAPAAPAQKAPAQAPVAKKLAPAAQAPAAPAQPSAQPAPVVDDLMSGFHALLAPHGEWVKDPSHGLLWVPDAQEVGADFAPYRTGGRWGVTEEGEWAWVSDYDWGKVPFHYGRWIWSPERKWAWIPDDEYAPAWVVWRTGDAGYDFVGWAPMAPTQYLMDEGPVPAKSGVLPFSFVSTRHLFTPDVGKHVITDRKLGKAIHEHSNIHDGHVVDGAVDGAASDAPLEAASPTFGEARIPAFAIPKTRLSEAAEAIAPLTLESVRGLLGLPAMAPPAAAPEQQLEGAPAEAPPTEALPAEAPAPAHAAEAPAEAPKAPPPVVDGEAKRFATPPPVYNKKRIRYRCWWTNTRPRIWRCGY